MGLRVKPAARMDKASSQCCAMAGVTQTQKLGNRWSHISLERSLGGFLRHRLSAWGFVTSLLSLHHCPSGISQGTCPVWEILVPVLVWLLLTRPFHIAQDVPRPWLSGVALGPQFHLHPCSGNYFRSRAWRGTRCSFSLLDLFGTSCLFISVLLDC